MKRRHFLRSSGLFGAGLALHRTAGAQDNNASVSRFLEVVRIICTQWHDNRRGEAIRMAMEAAGAGQSETFFNRPMDEMASSQLAFAVSRLSVSLNVRNIVSVR